MEDKFYAHPMEKKDGDWVVYGENYCSMPYISCTSVKDMRSANEFCKPKNCGLTNNF
jgi:hypothetical protein